MVYGLYYQKLKEKASKRGQGRVKYKTIGTYLSDSGSLGPLTCWYIVDCCGGCGGGATGGGVRYIPVTTKQTHSVTFFVQATIFNEVQVIQVCCRKRGSDEKKKKKYDVWLLFVLTSRPCCHKFAIYIRGNAYIHTSQ